MIFYIPELNLEITYTNNKRSLEFEINVGHVVEHEGEICIRYWSNPLLVHQERRTNL
jgi:hypothetical protein